MPLENLLPTLTKLNYDLTSTYHAEAILEGDYPGALAELDSVLGNTRLPVAEVIAGGGGEAKVTQRIRNALTKGDWKKRRFNVVKTIDGRETYSATHEIDHVKRFDAGVIALEIEWNNKDPFYDRDLENFQRLHADGAISVGIIVTRGQSFQEHILEYIIAFARENHFEGPQALNQFDVNPTPRQLENVENMMQKQNLPYSDAWARFFVSDKFGAATTHWNKLQDRLDRGVGSPCPVIGIGMPIDIVVL